MTDGRLQVTAALSLLENSKLIAWDPHSLLFDPADADTFNFSWRNNVDPVFGRLICWMNFSAGAEFLAKGVCLVRGIEIRKERDIPIYPSTDVDAWIPQFQENWKCNGTIPATNFGTLGNLVNSLSNLCDTVGASKAERELLSSAYELLRSAIRNRDAHAYVPNVRDTHFHLVPDLFSPCFNVLVSWLPDGPKTLSKWREESQLFISAL